LQQPAVLVPRPIEVNVAATTFDRYAGYYDFPPARMMSIYRDGDRFFAQLTGQPPIQIYARSEREFFSKDVEAQGTIEVGPNGEVTKLVFKQGGREIHAPRMDSAVATIRAERLAERIRNKIALPGTAAGLRKHLDGLGIDQPVYDLMTKEIADSVRAGWHTAKARYPQLGQLQSIDFTGVGPVGADIYVATYENGKSEWRVHVNEAGQMDILNYRRLVSP
jgi:hypothetical protein